MTQYVKNHADFSQDSLVSVVEDDTLCQESSIGNLPAEYPEVIIFDTDRCQEGQSLQPLLHLLQLVLCC